MLTLTVAAGADRGWAVWAVRTHHYLHKPPDPRSRPLCYCVQVQGERVGCLWFGRPESTRCYCGGLTYGGMADVATGRAAYDRWEVLNLSRLWLAPDVQAGGSLCHPGAVPGFLDRRGLWRPAVASAAIAAALGRVGYDYLLLHPPVYVEQPYMIRAVLSYCDTHQHRGAVYRAAGFRPARCNAAGIETWFTTAVTPLTAPGHAAVCLASARSARARRLRARSAPVPSLWDNLS